MCLLELGEGWLYAGVWGREGVCPFWSWGAIWRFIDGLGTWGNLGIWIWGIWVKLIDGKSLLDQILELGAPFLLSFVPH